MTHRDLDDVLGAAEALAGATGDLAASITALSGQVDQALEEIKRLREQRDLLFAAARSIVPVWRGQDGVLLHSRDLARLAAAVYAVEQAQREARP